MRNWEQIQMKVGEKAEFPQDFICPGEEGRTSLVLKQAYDKAQDIYYFYVDRVKKPIVDVPTYLITNDKIKFWTEIIHNISKYDGNKRRKIKIIVKRSCNGQERTGLAIL